MEIIKLINQKKSLLISLNILFILLVFTLLIWRSLNDALKKRSEMIFQQEVSEIQILIEERIDDYVNTLYGLRGLFAASNDLITREQWNIYCDQLNLKKHIPGIHSLSFNEYFTASDKQNFIKNIHKDCAFSEKGLPDFNIFTSVPINTQSDPPQLEFCVANYIWPWEENKVAFGHELFSDPVRGELLRKIRDNDHLGITTQFVLINDLGENTPAFGVYLPVYRSKKPLTSIRQRRTALCGFVAARFRAKDLIRSILLEYSRYPNIDLEIYDGETPVVEKLYYNDDDIMQAITPEYKSRFTSSSVLMLYNHPWILHFTAKPNFSLEKTHQNFPAVILILGISLSFIIAGSFYSLQTSRDRALLLANKITSQYEAQRALSIRSDRLRSLGQMAAGIAHELNQPLVGVRGLAEHILIGKERGWNMDEKTIMDKISLIVEQSDRMAHIIDHVRTFAREAGKPEVRPVNINDIVESSTDLLGVQFASHGLILEKKLAKELPQVLANPFSLEEVVLNLIMNGRDAVETRLIGEPRLDAPGVEVQTKLEEEKNKKWVKIEIIDNGTGIPKNIMDKIFDPFFTTKEPAKGTGLGLAISKTIVEDFNGKLEIQSIPLTQTTATIWLPVIK